MKGKVKLASVVVPFETGTPKIRKAPDFSLNKQKQLLAEALAEHLIDNGFIIFSEAVPKWDIPGYKYMKASIYALKPVLTTNDLNKIVGGNKNDCK